MADLTQKVVGYRYFRDVDGALGSQGHTQWIWGRGIHEATCDKGATSAFFGAWQQQSIGGALYGTSGNVYSYDTPKPEKPCKTSPGHNCTCGLHAYHAVPEAKRPPFVAPGSDIPAAILAWGGVEVHANGFRAQYAELLALGFNENWPRTVIERIKTVARDYEVDCLPLSHLEAFAEAHGAPVPADLFPAPVEPKPVQQSANPVKRGFEEYYMWSEQTSRKQKRRARKS